MDPSVFDLIAKFAGSDISSGPRKKKDDEGKRETDKIAAERDSQGTTVVIFSKDRPFQLRECLRSFALHDVDEGARNRIVVLVKSDVGSRNRKLYESVKEYFDNRHVSFVYEVDFSDQLKSILKNAKERSRTIMFTVDDAFFYRDFSLQECTNVLDRNDDIYAVHLKMHKHVTYCHPANKDLVIPPLRKDPGSSFLKFERASGSFDWNYPWDLAGSVYRHADVMRMIRAIESRFGTRGTSHPNRLEASGHRCALLDATAKGGRLDLDKMPRCAVPPEACMSVLTLNCVQSVFPNRIYACAEEYSLERLNGLLSADVGEYQIDGAAYRNLSPPPRAVHIGELYLVHPNGKVDTDRRIEVQRCTKGSHKKKPTAATVPTVPLRSVIFDPAAFLKKKTTVVGSVAFLDRGMRRMDITDQGAKLICELPSSPPLSDNVVAGAQVAVTGFVRKERRRTFVKAIDVRSLVPKIVESEATTTTKSPFVQKKAPLVSVLLPVFNGAPFLREALESVLGQTWKNFELIVVDDGSVDKSLEIAREYAKMDSRVVVVEMKSNSGIVNALNRGIEIARGCYVARMDADDVCDPKRLERQVTFMEAHPRISVVGGGVRMISADRKREVALSADRVVRHPCNAALVHFGMFFYCSLVHPSVMLRTKTLRQHGGYRNTYKHAEDYDLWLRLLEDPDVVVSNISDVVLCLRKHGRNISTLRAKEQRDSALRAAWRSFNDRVSLLRSVSLRDFEALRRCTRDDSIETEEMATAACDILVAVRDSILDESPNRYHASELAAVKEDCRNRLGFLAALATRKFPGSGVTAKILSKWMA
eukprot:g2620.t1